MTEAVKVTLCPQTDGFGEDVREVEVEALTPVPDTFAVKVESKLSKLA